jgi:hypothetical protein
MIEKIEKDERKCQKVPCRYELSIYDSMYEVIQILCVKSGYGNQASAHDLFEKGRCPNRIFFCK